MLPFGGGGACEAGSATKNLDTKPAPALEPKKTTENDDRVGRLQENLDVNQTPASSPPSNMWALTLVLIWAVSFPF
jgi:hypothetical protein